MTDKSIPETTDPKKPTEFETKANEYSNICAQLGEKEHLIRNAKSQCDAWHEQLNTLQKKLVVLRNAEQEIAKKKAAELEALTAKSPLPPEVAPTEASSS